MTEQLQLRSAYDLTPDDWGKLLEDETVFTTDALKIMKRMKDCGGQSTCTQLAAKYGKTKNYYLTYSIMLARRVCQVAEIKLVGADYSSENWLSVLYTTHKAEKDEVGSSVWKLRDNLAIALDKVDLSGVELYAKGEEHRHYWWLMANPRVWRFSDFPINESQPYGLYNENGNKRRIYKNFLEAKVGDSIICYESAPVKQIVALGRVTAAADGEKLCFEKTEALSTPIDYTEIKACPELEHMEFIQSTLGSLSKLTKDEYDFLTDMIREVNPFPPAKANSKCDKSAFLSEVFMSEESYDDLVALLEKKRNVILQGAPGVGKTFAAERLAYSIMGEKDKSRVKLVQFHQNYSYEDFVMGYKPDENGFKLQDGIFYSFCKKAENDPNNKFFFIIDEINRGNLSKIFGELLMLIENEHRGDKVTLAYNGLSFSVPKNLYIIGMMNTADRSLAMIDYALRRRFSFFDMKPAFDSEGFENYRKGLNNATFDRLIEEIKKLNEAISEDSTLGKGFCIGHSYFCSIKTTDREPIEAQLRSVVNYDILPTLREYWFDDEKKFEQWKSNLEGALQ